MSELGCQGLTLSFGGPTLLDDVRLQVEKGERVALVGRNGSGKSTLLRALAGRIVPDGGEITQRRGARVTWLEQEVPRDLAGTVREQLQDALRGVELAGDWEADSRIEENLARLQLAGEDSVAELSAGSKRRVLLARALVADPDVLLLDEPTNHLDLEAIAGLEELLLRREGALVFVSHDRRFTERLATRIVLLDRGSLMSYACSYTTYLERRDAELAAEEEQNAQFDKKLAQEEAWLRRGVKARRTRNMGRVRALKALRDERSERRDATGRVRAELQEGGRTGQLVLRAKGLTHSFGDQRIVDGLDLELGRGDRVAILGPNGCGKTTLIQLLLGELTPDAGTVKLGTNLELARFDQLHSVLDDSKTLRENVVEEGDMVAVGGRSRHVVGYLQDFLFTKEQVQGSITKLSGGERNRLQLARLLARPCNLLVLDEPTNDLDLETLELLEELLSEYTGTLLLVSHDRAFVDNVVTSTLVFDGERGVVENVGGYSDWLERKAREEAERAAAQAERRPAQVAAPARTKSESARRLSWKEQQELEQLPARIEQLEAEQAALEARLGDPDFYKSAGDEVATVTARLEVLGRELADNYERWEALEALSN